MDTTTQEIELEITQAQELVRLGEALERLYANADFQAIIGKGYFQDEAIRLVHLKGDPTPSNQTPEMQASIVKEIDAIASLAWYFRKVLAQAQGAREAIQESEEFLEEIRNGEDE
jgi:hypothetical protein